MGGCCATDKGDKNLNSRVPQKKDRGGLETKNPKLDTPPLDSTKKADTVQIGEYERNDDVAEVHGSANWDDIFL